VKFLYKLRFFDVNEKSAKFKSDFSIKTDENRRKRRGFVDFDEFSTVFEGCGVGWRGFRLISAFFLVASHF
jgi:hypothetical protein